MRGSGMTHMLSSARGVREGDLRGTQGPVMVSLGISALLEDLAATLGPSRLILAYLDDIYILSNGPATLDEMHSFFSTLQPSIQVNMAKSKTVALEDVRENALDILGSCKGPTAVRECFLEAKITAEEALLDRLGAVPHRHALFVLRQDLLSPGLCRPFRVLRRLLAPVLCQDTALAFSDIPSQRERCQEAITATRDALMESLDAQAA
jgi:hypothetical protein